MDAIWITKNFAPCKDIKAHSIFYFDSDGAMSVCYAISCFLSTFLIVLLVIPSFYGLPIFEQTRITAQAGFVVATLVVTLCGIQCTGIGIRQGMPTNVFLWNWPPLAADDIFVVIISQGLMDITYGGRKTLVYFYFLPMVIMSFFLPPARPLSTSTRKRTSTSKRKSRKKKGNKSVSDASEDPDEEKPLILTTPSPSPMATPTTPSLIVSNTILGILFSLSSTSSTHDYSTFQVAVRTMQSSTKVYFKAEQSLSNVTNKIWYL